MKTHVGLCITYAIMFYIIKGLSVEGKKSSWPKTQYIKFIPSRNKSYPIRKQSSLHLIILTFGHFHFYCLIHPFHSLAAPLYYPLTPPSG